MRNHFNGSHLFEKNRQKLTRRLPAHSLLIVNSNDEMPRTADQYYPYRQHSDLIYLTGIHQPKSILCICPGSPDKQLREVLFIEKTNEQYNIWTGQKMDKEEATAISGIKNVQWLEEFERLLPSMMKYALHVYLGCHEENRTFDEVPLRDARFAKWMLEQYPLHKYERLNFLMAEMRQIKESEEIEFILQAINISSDAFKKIAKAIKPGIYEYEAEALFGYEFVMSGAEGHAFQPIVASGKNACVLHYSSNNELIGDGSLVLLDFGAEWGAYNADITRTIPANGKFSKRQTQVYEAVLRLLKLAPQLIKAGKSISAIHTEFIEFAEKEMIQLGLFSENEKANQDPEKPLYRKYFMHGISHFLGLDVHDVGQKTDILMPGMVITWEPGIYITEEQLGIRLENDILITDNGIVNLSELIPIEINDIEALMKDR